MGRAGNADQARRQWLSVVSAKWVDGSSIVSGKMDLVVFRTGGGFSTRNIMYKEVRTDFSRSGVN